MPGAGESRFAMIVLLTWLISIAGFAHVVVGSAEVSFLVLSGQASVTDYLRSFFTPTLLGNVVGSVPWLQP
jgi:formate/nitrite transporter FocA (FNT family)